MIKDLTAQDLTIVRPQWNFSVNSFAKLVVKSAIDLGQELWLPVPISFEVLSLLLTSALGYLWTCKNR
jgi:hypothetical protein